MGKGADPIKVLKKESGSLARYMGIFFFCYLPWSWPILMRAVINVEIFEIRAGVRMVTWWQCIFFN